MNLKTAYNQATEALKSNDTVFVNYYETLAELLNDGMDEESLNEIFFVWGRKGTKPSDLKEPFVLVEVTGADGTPIFVEENCEMLISYLKANHANLLQIKEE